MTSEVAAEDGDEMPLEDRLSSTSTLWALVTAKFNLRSSVPRKGEQQTLAFIPVEGYDGFKAKVNNIIKGNAKWCSSKMLEDGAIFFKQTKSAKQADYRALNADNFWELLQARWACVAGSDKAKLALKASVLCRPLVEVFDFEFFVYFEPPKKHKPTMYRATAARMARAVEEVARLHEQQGIALGPITAHHVAVHHARQADDTPVTVPNGNTTRQAQALDEEMARLDAQQQQDSSLEDYAEIEVQLFGAWVRVPVRVSSIRAALRLPQHDIFTRGIFHGYIPQLVEPTGEDVHDTDHMQPGAQPSQ